MFYEQAHSSNKDYMKISASIGVNVAFPLHLHGNCEFIYVEEGCLRVGINGVSFDVHGGEGAFILPNQPHEFFTPAYSKSWLVIFSEDHVPYIRNIVSAGNFLSPVISPALPDLRERLLNARSNPFRVRSILYELAAVYAEGEAVPELAMENGALVSKVVAYINAHYAEPLTLEKMAQELGYSYRYMSGVVNRFFKLPLPTVVNRYRVNRACELLADGVERVTDIALLCGFGSIRNFNRSFKALTGVSPVEYREQKR